jgi:uncharacterized Zn finger protein
MNEDTECKDHTCTTCYYKPFSDIRCNSCVHAPDLECYHKEREEEKKMTKYCPKCGNADNFAWEEIQRGKPWLIICRECGHSWPEGSEEE